MAQHGHLQQPGGLDHADDFSALGASAAVRMALVAVLLIVFWFSVVWALAE